MTPLEHVTFGALLDQVASKTPTPGGGAVAGIVGAVAAALGSMVVSYSVGKKSLLAHEPLLLEAAQTLSRLRDRCMRLGDEDAAAYERLNTLQRLAPDDPERAMKYAAAVDEAIGVPLSLARVCHQALQTLAGLAGRSNPHLKSDLAIAGLLALAGAEAARWNVVINLREIADEARRSEIRAEADRIVAACGVLKADLDRACA